MISPDYRDPIVQDELRKESARNSLFSFGRYLDPVFADLYPRGTAFMELLCDKLERCYTGEIRRMMVMMPARHGKSYAVSRLFPIWALGKNPKLRFIMSTYGAELTEEFSGYHLNMMRTPEYANVFDTRLDPRKANTSVWRTTERGQVVATGVNGPIYGRGGNILIIDDPYKNWEEAHSPVIRRKMLEWYRGYLSRLSKGGTIILVMHRWVEEDLADVLLDEDSEYGAWDVVKFKALADPSDDDPDPLGREKGEALCPQIMPAEELEEKRREMKSAFEAQYQQEPDDQAERIFPPPHRARPEGEYTVQAFWDPAYGAEDKNDMNALTIGGRHPLNDSKGRSVAQISHGYCWRGQINDSYDKVERYCIQHGVEILHIEDEKATTGSKSRESQSPLAYEMNRRFRAANREIIVKPMRQTKNKHFRIVNYLANNFERVRWNPDIDSRYMKHILKYNELTSVKDPADSAASLVRLLLRHPGKKGGDDPGGGGSPGPGPRKPESGKVRTAGSVRRNIRRYGGGRGSRW